MYLTDLQYFPNINYIHTLYRSRSVIFSGLAPFKKSSFRNRMQLPSSNGVLTLSIPIKGGRSVTSGYHDVLIDYTIDWQQHHLKTIKSIYGNSPYFQYYSPMLEDLYATEVVKLFEWNIKCLDIFLKLSKMSAHIHYSISYSEPGGQEYDNISRNDALLPAYPPYPQVFSNKLGFKSNMSCLDMLMNLGHDSVKYIMKLGNKP